MCKRVKTQVWSYKGIDWTVTTCRHCGATVERLGNRGERFCHHCGIEYRNAQDERESAVKWAWHERQVSA